MLYRRDYVKSRSVIAGFHCTNSWINGLRSYLGAGFGGRSGFGVKSCPIMASGNCPVIIVVVVAIASAWALMVIAVVVGGDEGDDVASMASTQTSAGDGH